MAEIDERPFHHEKNLVVGRGRILYDSAGGIKDGEWRVPGWVLPGGRRTTSAEEAVAAATWIDAELSRTVQVGGAQTRQKVEALGLWPARLERWKK